LILAQASDNVAAQSWLSGTKRTPTPFIWGSWADEHEHRNSRPKNAEWLPARQRGHVGQDKRKNQANDLGTPIFESLIEAHFGERMLEFEIDPAGAVLCYRFD
jgi:hypothetical protein